MGNCWLKLKFKAKSNNNDSNKNSFNYLSKKEKKTKKKKKMTADENNKKVNKTSCTNNSVNAIALNETQSKKQVVLQPRRDCADETDLEINAVAPPQASSNNNTPMTSTNNFKQFCKNSADKLTHKLSFNKLKQQQTQADSNLTDNLTVSESKIISLFEKYKDEEEVNLMLANGIQQLCDDLNLKADDFRILLLAWKLRAKQMCKFTKDEFVNGFKNNLKVDNLKDLKLKLAYFEDEIKLNQNEFKSLYRWTFDFGLDSDTGERVIPIDMAISLWKLVYTNQEPHILSRWLKYLADNVHIKGIPRDTWCMFPLFAKSIGEFNYHLYDDNEAWPCLFDDYVQFEISTAALSATEVKIDVNNNNNFDN